MAALARTERLDVRLPRGRKRAIEQAAAQLNQSVTDFVVTTLTRRARKVLREHTVLELSNRDRDRFLAALDDADAQPSPTLRRAAERHKQLVG